MTAGDKLGTHLDGLDRTCRACLQGQPDCEQDDAGNEQRVRPEHEQPDPAQCVRRAADHRPDGPAHRGCGQLVASGLLGLETDQPGRHGDVADHHEPDDNAQRHSKPEQPPAVHDQRGQAEKNADNPSRCQDDGQVRPGLGEGRPDLRAAGLGDREREYGVQVEARRGDHSDAKHQRDHDRRSLQLVERLAVQHVNLQVQHGRPDPHRGQHLDQGEPPVAEQQLDPVEEHREGSDGQGKGSQPRPGAAQPQEHLVHDLPVAVPDGLDELPDLRTRYMPPPGRPVDTARRCGPARSVGRRCRRLLGCIPLNVHWDALHEQLR